VEKSRKQPLPSLAGDGFREADGKLYTGMVAEPGGPRTVLISINYPWEIVKQLSVEKSASVE